MKGKRVFSLIEFLVVSALLLLIASLLMTSLKQISEKSKSISDSTKMKRIHASLVLYHDDNEVFPLSHTKGDRRYWMERLYLYFDEGRSNRPFLSDQLSDPEVIARNTTHFSATTATMPVRSYYQHNYKGVKISEIRRPRQLVLIKDGAIKDRRGWSHFTSHGHFKSEWFRGVITTADDTNNRDKLIDYDECLEWLDFRQGEKSHLMFVDGHVEGKEIYEIKYSYFTNAY